MDDVNVMSIRLFVQQGVCQIKGAGSIMSIKPLHQLWGGVLQLYIRRA